MRMNDELFSRVSHNLKTMRENTGYLQHEVAQIIGVHKSTLSRWEAGIVDPGILGLVTLGNFYGVSVIDILDAIPPRPHIIKPVPVDPEAVEAARAYDEARKESL